MSTHDKTRRLFFALWPSDQTRQSIVDTCAGMKLPTKGRTIQPHNLHITLHFVGPVTEDVKHCMHLAAQSVKANVFSLELDTAGYFSRAKVFWLGCEKLPSELMQLHHDLGAAIAICGYKLEARVYSPHVTLMRKCRRPDLKQLVFSIPWQVEEFVLIESIIDKNGVDYQVIEKYPLS